MRTQSQWLFEAPLSPSIPSDQPRFESWLFEPIALSEADHMAGKRRKGKEHTSLNKGSKTRLKQKHQPGQARKLGQETAADQRNENTARRVEQRKRARASSLTGLERPTKDQVLALIEAKEREQERVRTQLAIARQRGNHTEVEELQEKFVQLEKQIKDLRQFRLTLR